jgi:hypothetical protein
MKKSSEVIYQNKFCRIIAKDTFYVLQSKKGNYNDQYFQSLDQCYLKTGLPPLQSITK